ncbi:hypothetical protein B0T20DRAFT_388614 [Sordaria brevicollis]|uniref:Uncharacterized protein n=1 Tax=Sordaria brevicollis TaxID=83679 RepID=A0AAE0UG55_SORBR|nr:hypothetical protein B0T20DRAFT_388614 [Sordaria brevicollis]
MFWPKFNVRFPRFVCPVWVPDWVQVFPWFFGTGPVLGGLIGLVLHPAVFVTSLHHPVDNWGFWIYTDPSTTGMIIANAESGWWMWGIERVARTCSGSGARKEFR